LIALILRIADGDVQQRFRIQELKKAGGQRVCGMVVSRGALLR
jgi:hypothetical protein